jgi:hypothetical protein
MRDLRICVCTHETPQRLGLCMSLTDSSQGDTVIHKRNQTQSHAPKYLVGINPKLDHDSCRFYTTWRAWLWFLYFIGIIFCDSSSEASDDLGSRLQSWYQTTVYLKVNSEHYSITDKSESATSLRLKKWLELQFIPQVLVVINWVVNSWYRRWSWGLRNQSGTVAARSRGRHALLDARILY